jgi:outer membrane protein OmpA-like peptidoglycan-associated protein
LKRILFRLFYVPALVLIVYSASAIGQDVLIPKFESFSYFRDPLFRLTAPSNSDPGVDCAVSRPASVTQSKNDILECLDVSSREALSRDQRFELQLALDKALSQILKLTVDYESLRRHVENISSSNSKKKADGWFSIDDSGNENVDKFKELMELSAKRLSDRDQQLTVLKNRLSAMQLRYDNENVSRLLAEKRYKIIKDKGKKAGKKDARTRDKMQFLTNQLEKNQLLIRQLRIDLTDEQLKVVKLKSVQNSWSQPLVETEEKNETESVSVIEPEAVLVGSLDEDTTSSSVSSLFSPAAEWLLEGLEFKEGSVDIELDSIHALGRLVNHLQQNEELSIQINGYTDSIGSATANLKLSQARAEAVADYLIKQGIEFFRIKALGYGERRPVADNQTEQGRVLNRRVAVLLMD